MSIPATQLRPGMVIKHNNDLHGVFSVEHRTPGNLRAFYQIKMRNVRNGKVAENRFRPGEEVEILRVETKEYQYLYADGDSLVCMDNITFDQVYIDKRLLGNSVNFIKEGVTLLIAFENGDSAITAEAPTHVVMEVQYTEPGMQGDTATRTLKPATLENGVEIRVPLFVNTGDKIKVQTSTGDYVERVKE